MNGVTISENGSAIVYFDEETCRMITDKLNGQLLIKRIQAEEFGDNCEDMSKANGLFAQLTALDVDPEGVQELFFRFAPGNYRR